MHHLIPGKIFERAPDALHSISQACRESCKSRDLGPLQLQAKDAEEREGVEFRRRRAGAGCAAVSVGRREGAGEGVRVGMRVGVGTGEGVGMGVRVKVRVSVIWEGREGGRKEDGNVGRRTKRKRER